MAQTASTSERLLTRFLIYETPDNGITLHGRGDVLASGRDQALRQFLRDHPEKDDGKTVFATASENGLKLHIPSPRIVIGGKAEDDRKPGPRPGEATAGAGIATEGEAA